MIDIRPAAAADAPALAKLRWEFRASRPHQRTIETEEAFVRRCADWMRRELQAGGVWRAWVAAATPDAPPSLATGDELRRTGEMTDGPPSLATGDELRRAGETTDGPPSLATGDELRRTGETTDDGRRTTSADIVGQVWLQLFTKLPNPVDERERLAYLSNLYVRPTERGGVGVRLLEAALALAEKEDVDRVVLWPSARSVSLYERHAFRRVGDVMELVCAPPRKP